MARKISFLNFKGGVGKSSIIVNYAAILAHQGKRVLLVDCDPQSNSSIWLLRLDRWNELQSDRPDETLLNVLVPGGVPLAHAIQRDIVLDQDKRPSLPGLDLVTASFSLMDIEHEVEEVENDPVFLRFYRQVESIEADYDVILFDCPPNMFKTTQCALFASDDVYCPANPDALSIIGFHLLVNKLLMFHAASDGYRHLAGAGAGVAAIRGVILNGLKTGVNFDGPRQRLQIMIERFIKKHLVADDAGLLDVEIRHTVHAGRLVSQGIPAILSRDPEVITGLLADYKRMAELITEEKSSLAELSVKLN